MTPALAQLRKSFSATINRNKSTASFFLGNALKVERVRFVHESASVPANKTSPVGLSTSFSMFVELLHDTEVVEGIVLVEGATGWKVGPVDKLKVDGKVYGKRAPLTKIDSLNQNCSITSLKIGAVAGVISGTDITVTLPTGTDVSALSPVITHTGKMVSPVAAQNFTTPKTYTITAENLTQKIYTVTVVLA